jgi:UDP-3-O-[3-hydroxymyristoyl] glucosamine N-acyltransferase
VIHPTAIIGDPPEHRDWDPTMGLRPPMIHSKARIEALVTVDAGMFRNTYIGAGTWLMKKVHVGHDAIIGENCEIAPLTSIGGEVEIGDRVKVGQGATFKPCVKVGDDARIGMGAVVVKNVPAGETWVGNPARQLFPAALLEEEAIELRRKFLEPIR